MQTNKKRFWAKVNKHGSIPKNHKLGRCWIWTAASDHKGYGQFWFRDEDWMWHKYIAHRVSWMFKHGLIPNGKKICHKCDNPSCVRLSHLFIGTDKDNVQDCIAKGRFSFNFKPGITGNPNYR